MEDSRFDTLARSLSEARSRRGLTRLLGGLALGGALALRGLAETEAKKKKKKKKKSGAGICTPRCAGNCGDNGCGGSCGQCGACQSCQGGTCQSRCTPGQQCLAHQSCAITCTGADLACEGFNPGCSCRGTAEGGMHCRFSVVTGSCDNLQSCTSTADCLKSQMCQECPTAQLPNGKRCVAICGYECTSDAECFRTCHCSASNAEGHRHCETNSTCTGRTCTSSGQCDPGQHCSSVSCDGSVQKRCVTVCGTGTG